MFKLFLLPASFALFSTMALAQEPLAQTPPQLSPGAAYEEAMHPLETTRHSISNWSDTEMAALTVTMAQARDGCAARDPKNFTGSDLIDLARLCSLGQSFPVVVTATLRYIEADGPKPQLTQAYASLIDSLLRMKDEHDALTYALAMLDAVPYDTLTAETVATAIDFMQFVYTQDAMKLAIKREPLLLDRLRAATASAGSVQPHAATAPAYPGEEPPQSIHELYVDGVSFAALQQLSRAPSAEVVATQAALDAALPLQLAPDDSIPIATARRRYALLGKPLPDLAHPAHAKTPAALRSLDLPGEVPQLPVDHVITGLLLFPDWCAQCIRMATKLPQTVFTVKGHEATLYGLLAPTVAQTPTPPQPPKPPPPAAAPAPFAAADASNLLRFTATLVVDPSLLGQFAVTDVPVLILTDSQGIVRVLQPVSEEAVQPGGTIDSAIARIGDAWPNPQRLLPLPGRVNP